MERRIFNLLYNCLCQAGKTHCFKGKQFSDVSIVATLLWAALWERPISWACQIQNWPASWQGQLLPSPSTMSRRLRTIGVLTLLDQLHVLLAEKFPVSLCKWIDSKVLAVSPYSKDIDARIGHGRGFPARGYKIHVILDARSGMPDCWSLASMNRHDAGVAPWLIEQMIPGVSAYLVGDNAYDSNNLYDKAAEKQCQLLAPQRPSSKALGKCRHSAHRIKCRQLLSVPLSVVGQNQSFGQSILRQRIGIEQRFGYMGNIPGGLSSLPNWVRRPHRVALWVAAKFMIVAARRLVIKQLT